MHLEPSAPLSALSIMIQTFRHLSALDFSSHRQQADRQTKISAFIKYILTDDYLIDFTLNRFHYFYICEKRHFDKHISLL